MQEILRIENLKVYYYLPQGIVKAVDDVSFNVYTDEVLGIAGESGSGKSTVAHAILRLVKPPGEIIGGRILFKGRDLLKLSEDEMRALRGREITLIFQDPSTYLNPVYTVGFQIGEVYEAHEKVKPKKAIHKVVDILRSVKIPDPTRRIYSYPHELSGGMKQRILISMGIALTPTLIIADEPTSALDVTIQAQIIELLDEMRREIRASMIFITHDLHLLSEISNRIMVMYAGKCVEIGETSKITSDPLHPYTKALMQLLRYPRKSKLQSLRGSPPSLINPPRGCRFHPRCLYSMDTCREYEPNIVNINGRTVSCFLYSGRYG
ncbi:MAG: ABC transporter ATP-binding protein [Candidatus Methanomethylicia archaeon]